MSIDYGTGVLGTLSATGVNFETVIFQKAKPVLDKELNFLQDIQSEARARLIRNTIPSGFVTGRYLYDGRTVAGQKQFFDVTSLPSSTEDEVGDFITLTPAVGNVNKFTIRSQKAYVNGWEVILGHSSTGVHDAEVTLDVPSVSAGVHRYDFVFLEVWKQRVAASYSLGKSGTGKLFLHGNTESTNADNLTDDLIDGTVGAETTQRIQVQYRIRVVSGANNGTEPFAYPKGFEPSTVFGQGGAGSVSSFAFTILVFSSFNVKPSFAIILFMSSADWYSGYIFLMQPHN